MINWKAEPYRSAKNAVGHNKGDALELLGLFKHLKEIGLTDFREPKLVNHE
jgi:hypothetical protein